MAGGEWFREFLTGHDPIRGRFPGFFTGHRTCGSGQKRVELSRVRSDGDGSGRVRRCSKSDGSGRVGSDRVRIFSNLLGRVRSGRVGSGGVRRCFKSHGSGRVRSGRVGIGGIENLTGWVGLGRVGSGRVGSGRVGSGRVG